MYFLIQFPRALSQGLRHGTGTLSVAGKKYVGGFAAGVPAGAGTWHYSDGSEYKGELARGEREGQGTLWMEEAADHTDGEWRYLYMSIYKFIYYMYIYISIYIYIYYIYIYI